MGDSEVNSYMEFFGDDYLGAYHETISVENTLIETEFVQQVLRLPAGSEVLDLCCGHGRHSVLLANAGLNMTGLDLSEQYLKQAASYAKSAITKTTFFCIHEVDIPHWCTVRRGICMKSQDLAI